nr:hypothetical protein [Tanacetum cinerariifolium]
MEDTILELVEICRQKELLCMHDNVDDLIESALNSKLLLINSQRLDKKEQEVKNDVKQPVERRNQDESKCDMPDKDDCSSAFTTFSNPLFNNNDDLDSSDDESLHKDDVLIDEFKVYSNPLFNEDEINSDKLDPHCFNVEYDFVESLLNRDTFIDSSSKFDFSGELAHVNPEITEFDFDFEEEIYLIESLLYDNSSSQPPKEHNAKEERIKREHADYISRMEMLFTINPRPHPMVNSNTIIESLSSLPIPVQDSDSQREEIDIVTDTDDVLPPSVENDDDSKGEIDVVKELLSDNSIPLTEVESSDSDHQDDPSVPLPPPKPPDAETDAGDEISVVMNDELECLNPRDEFDVSDDYYSFTFVIYPEMFYFLLSAESEDTIFDPCISA